MDSSSDAFARPAQPPRRVAVVHEWLIDYSGSERVLEQILLSYPDADLYALVDFLPEADRHFLHGRQAQTSFIQRLPFAQKRFRNYLPLFPLAIEQFDLSDYDLIITSSHAVAKGVLTGPDQLHVSYVHSPMRYAWDLQHIYLRESGLTKGLKAWFARWVLHKLRIWDVRTGAGVNRFVANSAYIARRIAKAYDRASTVIYPPVDTDGFAYAPEKEDFYLTASRLVPYKKIDLIAEAFTGMPDKRLVIIGDGPEMDKVKSKSGANVEILGYQPFDNLRDHMQRARAFVFAAEEDFGIVPVEAQACGTPVIAYGRGGARETVRDIEMPDPTGIWFEPQTPEAIRDAVNRFEAAGGRISTAACRRNAERFSPDRFRGELTDFVDKAWAELQDLRDQGAGAVDFPEPEDRRRA